MTTIDRLGLTGIRSYGTEQETFIRFYRPLTIILGRNGSGKSTIIEAVKMAATGELPPMVDKGSAFIHDPRIDNETETKAKIRLQFTNARGDEYVVSRHFMLSIKRGLRGAKYKTEFKTLDQTLRRSTGEGKPAVTSFRCGDLNALLPEIMRVSKPILNNVIFVHQEESLWPLGDPKKLKEKFDDIFAATRYTRALEEIRKFRKAQGTDLKVLTVELQRFEDKVKLLDKLHGEADSLREKQNKLYHESQSTKAEVQELTKERDATMKIVKEYEEKMQEHSNYAREIQYLLNSQSELKSQMETFIKDLDDAGVELELQKNQERLKGIEVECLERTQAISEYTQKKEQLERDLNRRNMKRGRLEEQDRSYKENLDNVNAMKRSIQNGGFHESIWVCDVRIPSFVSDLDEWLRYFVEIEKQAELHYTTARDECRKAEKEAMTAFTDEEVKMRSLLNTLDNRKSMLTAMESDISRKRRQILSIGDVRTKYVEAREAEEIAQKQFEEKRNSSEAKELSRKMEKKRKDHVALYGELEETRAIRSRLESYRGAQTKVELSRKNMASKQQELRTCTEYLRDTLLSTIREVKDIESSLVGYVAPAGSFDFEKLRSFDLTENNSGDFRDELLYACQKIILRRESLMKFVQQTVSHSSSEKNLAIAQVSDLKNRFAHARSVLMEKELSLGRARDRLLKLPQVEGSPSIDELSQLFEDSLVVSDETACTMKMNQLKQVEIWLKSIDKERTSASNRVSISGAVPKFWRGIITRFEKDPSHSCPACGLSSAKRVEGMRAHMQSELARVEDPQHEASIREGVEKLNKIGEMMRNVRDLGASVVTSSETFSPLKDALSDASTKCKTCTCQYEEACLIHSNVISRLGPESTAGKLESHHADVLRVSKELVRLERDFNLARNELPRSSHSDHSIENVTSKLSSLEARLSDINGEKETLQKLADRERREMDEAADRLAKAVDYFRSLQKQGDDYERLEKDVKKLVMESRKLEKDISEYEPKIVEQRETVTNAELSNVTVRAEQQRILDKASKSLADLRHLVKESTSLIHRVRQYERSGKKDELSQLQKLIADIEDDITVTKADHEALISELKSATNSERGIESTIRNLRANRDYRQKEQLISATKRNMKHVQDDLNRIRGQVDGGNPKVKVDRIAKEIESQRERLTTATAQLDLYTEHYNLKKQELDKAERAGSRKQYNECRIQKQTMELASTDLDKYHRALDHALMAFHTLKMNSINRIIKELWQQTYRGTDIDEIEIMSDAGEALGNSSASSARRSYNYRVMMRQGQAQLDMRGRCSAGQKVLACLVIRLALAESFCTDCGILALDEPTTNLDQENIESLATALKSIIEIRRRQRNFQLVLITHDREFIDMIGARDFANEFFMVYKDSNGISHAKVQDLHQLPE